MSSSVESLFLSIANCNEGGGGVPDAHLQRLTNELLSTSTAISTAKAPWCIRLVGSLTTVLNSHSSTSKSKLLALSCLSLLASRVPMPLGATGATASGSGNIISGDEVISFRTNILLPAVLLLSEAMDEWLLDKEEASTQLGTAIGRQHEQILSLLLRATCTDCQWALSLVVGTGKLLTSPPLIDVPPTCAREVSTRGSFLSLQSILADFCSGRDVFLLGLLVGMSKIQNLDLLMVETITRLLCDMSIPKSYFVGGNDSSSDQGGGGEMDLREFQGRINTVQAHCLQHNVIETIVASLFERIGGARGSKNSQLGAAERVLWGQAVSNVSKFVLNILEFSTASRSVQNQWMQTVLPLRHQQQKASSSYSSASSSSVSLITSLFPLLVQEPDTATASNPSLCRAQATQMYWVLRLVATVFFEPVSFNGQTTTPAPSSCALVDHVNDEADFSVAYYRSIDGAVATSSASSLLYESVDNTLSQGVSDFVLAQVKLLASDDAAAPNALHLRRLLLTCLRAFINLNHSGGGAKALINRVVNTAHDQNTKDNSESTNSTYVVLRQVIAEVYGDLMAASEDLATHTEAYFDIVQVHIWGLLTGSTRKVTSSNNNSRSTFSSEEVDTTMPNPLAMTDDEIAVITTQLDNDIHSMEKDISDLGNMMQDVRSSSTSLPPPPIASAVTTAGVMSSLSDAPSLVKQQQGKDRTTTNLPLREEDDLSPSTNLRRAKRQDGSVPKELCCMWTGKLMREPIKVPDGQGGHHWFDLSSLETVSGNVGSVNPLTGESLPDAIADGIGAGGDAIVDLSLQRKITKFKVARKRAMDSVSSSP